MSQYFTFDTKLNKVQRDAAITDEATHANQPDDQQDVLHLQRVIGNRNVQRLTQTQVAPVRRQLPTLPGTLQAKLAVSPADDSYEHEADAVAQAVMNAPEPVQRQDMPEEDELLMAKRLQRQDIPEEDEELMMKRLQRQDIPEEDEELMMKRLQRQDIPEEDEELMMKRLQRNDLEAGTPAVSGELENQIVSSQGNGQQLPDETRTFFESRFGRDFSGVTIHTDSASDNMSEQIQARAFTTGRDIYFRDGEYNPHSNDGRELLAHELTHVVQQGGADVHPKYADDHKS